MRVAIHILVYLVASLVGILLLLLSFHPEWQAPVLAWSETTGGWVVLVSVGTVFVLSPFVLLALWWGESLRSREISYTTDSGRIAVNLVAIEEALTRALEGEPEVKKSHVRVYEDRVKRQVIIDAVMTLWEVPNVTERNRFCQRLLRRRFAELMPEQNAVVVNLSVHRLNVRRPDAPPAPTSAAPTPALAQPTPAVRLESRTGFEPAEGELYVGPSYPVMRDDDDDSSLTRPPTARVPRPPPPKPS